MEANNWNIDILNSSNGITKVTPDPLLFSKIKNRIKKQNRVGSQWIWIAAASFIVLLSINIKMLLLNTTKTTVPTESIVSSVSNSCQLY